MSDRIKHLVLFDFSNLAHRCVHLKQVMADSPYPKWAFWHYLVFSAMYEYLLQLFDEYPEDTFEVVLALDSHTGYWRRDLYAPYKMDRQEKRAASGIDWEQAFEEFELFVENVRNYLPWKCISAPKCEADDVIYTLSAEHVRKGGEVFIHSADSDYLMLVSDKVHVFNPMRREYMLFPHACKVGSRDWVYTSAEEYKVYSILTGQSGKDNVYNVKTPTDFEGARRPGFGVVAASKLLSAGNLEEELERQGMLDNYRRNKSLIDPSQIPDVYYESIKEVSERYEFKNVDVVGYIQLHSWNSLPAEDVDIILRSMTGLEVCVGERPVIHVEIPDEEEAIEFTL